jgi:hypothetical protein
MVELDTRQLATYEGRLKRLKMGTRAANLVWIAVMIYGLTRTDQSAIYVIGIAGGAGALINVCALALKTALRPIPAPATATPASARSEDDPAQMNEPSPSIDPTAVQTPLNEPAPVFDDSPVSPASLVEVEEVPTHPPFEIETTQPLENSDEPAAALADQETELDPKRAHLRNPDAPVMTVPNAALRNTPEDSSETPDES